jgi:hypothetical protein
LRTPNGQQGTLTKFNNKVQSQPICGVTDNVRVVSNMNTAKALGLRMLPGMMVRATRVI